MKRVMTILTCLAILVLTGCESGELGMKIKIVEQPVPDAVGESTFDSEAGDLKLILVKHSGGSASELATPLVNTFNLEGTPKGELTFVSLSVRTPRMEQPPRASAEIDAVCIWRKDGKKAVCYKISVETFSIEIEDFDRQLKYLRDEGLKGMAKELADKL